MSLKFGWRPQDIRESIWRGDDALGEVPATAMAAWEDDADAMHLRPFCTKGQPQIIRYRSLTTDEKCIVQAYFLERASTSVGPLLRAKMMAFRIGVSFDGKADHTTPDGVKTSISVNERGIWMLADPFVRKLDLAYPGMVDFYGGKVLDGAFVDETEKKASSPPSTPTPSGAAEFTAATTELPPPTAGA